MLAGKPGAGLRSGWALRSETEEEGRSELVAGIAVVEVGSVLEAPRSDHVVPVRSFVELASVDVGGEDDSEAAESCPRRSRRRCGSRRRSCCSLNGGRDGDGGGGEGDGQPERASGTLRAASEAEPRGCRSKVPPCGGSRQPACSAAVAAAGSGWTLPCSVETRRAQRSSCPALGDGDDWSVDRQGVLCAWAEDWVAGLGSWGALERHKNMKALGQHRMAHADELVLHRKEQEEVLRMKML